MVEYRFAHTNSFKVLIGKYEYRVFAEEKEKTVRLESSCLRREIHISRKPS